MDLRRVTAPVGVCVADVVAKGAFDIGLDRADGDLEQRSGLAGIHRLATVAMAAPRPWVTQGKAPSGTWEVQKG